MKTSLWLNVDPLTENYPNIGGYVYALNNPINLIDPDGMAPGDPPYIKNNVHFIHFSRPTANVIRRTSGGTFTDAALKSDSKRSNEYIVNMQQYEMLTYSAKASYYVGSNVNLNEMQTQGLTVANGKTQPGGRSSNSYFISQNNSGNWSAGIGDPPSDSKIGFGGGIPLIVNGMPYGASKKYDSKGKMIQNSSAGFPMQNNNTVGKTVLAFDGKGNFMIVSQENGVNGLTLDGIRNELVKNGYTNAVSFDGSTSATLVKDNKIITKPDSRKDNSIPVGVQIR